MKLLKAQGASPRRPNRLGISADCLVCLAGLARRLLRRRQTPDVG